MSSLPVAAHVARRRGRRRGECPTTVMHVYFLHGVGMWPGLFGSLRDRLDRPSVAPMRPGYGPEPATHGLSGQVAAVRRLLEDHGPGILVGVSGGATLALASVVAGVDGVRGIVTHEPLVGPLVPELHRTVVDAAEAVRAVDAGRIDDFLLTLYGPSWPDRSASARRFAREHRTTIAREVAHFAAFAPSRDALCSLAVPHLTTVGDRSAPERHRVAELLTETGASASTIPGAGHLVPVDNPGGFVELIEGFAREVGSP